MANNNNNLGEEKERREEGEGEGEEVCEKKSPGMRLTWSSNLNTVPGRYVEKYLGLD